MPKAKSRTHSFTNRGKHFGNIWASFSYKAKNDVQLYSDVELGYWLLKIEFDPSITRYELHPLPRLISCPQPRKISLTAEVMTRDGNLEWHLLCSNQQYSPVVIKELERYANSIGVRLRLFCAEDIELHKSKIIPLLKVCACLSSWHAIEVNYDAYHGLIAFIHKRKRGCLRDLFQATGGASQSLACFLIARLYSEGILNVEVLPGFFDCAAWWEAL
ncbi:hypothetical protein [Pseudomonas sp. NPDC096950]|uniref:hypothetical protein n=1 Tax=Pseudomonas sp. NPDC096950 TaxID=3364485 RepID=UPI00383B9D10